MPSTQHPSARPREPRFFTGRNHHRVGNGTIAERASDFDGYTGIIPTTSATIAEVLHHYLLFRVLKGCLTGIYD